VRSLFRKIKEYILSMELDPCGCDICCPVKGVCPYLDPNRKHGK
jgi:hypothetical protein